MELIAPEWEVEMKVKSYNATFVKSSGEERTMNFVRNSDLPSNFLDLLLIRDTPVVSLNLSSVCLDS